MSSFVLVHGSFHGGWCWDAVAARLTAAGHRVAAPDLPGRGADAATLAALSLDDYAARIAEVVAAQAEPVVLVGHSMGGLVAQETYFRHPELVKALVLTFTSAAFVGGSNFAKQFVAERVGPLDAGQTMAEIAAQLMPTHRGSKSDPKGAALAERMMGAIPPETYRKATHLLTTFDRRADLPKIAVPTFLIAGSDDKTAPPAIMASMQRKIPGSELLVLEGCGHLGPMDQPAEFNAALERFLRKMESRWATEKMPAR